MNHEYTPKEYHQGFTLIEILLVMLITSFLVLGVNAAFRQTHMLWSRVEMQRPVYQKTRMFFNTITEELLYIYIPEMNDNQQQSAPFTLSQSTHGSVKLSFLTMNPAWKNTAGSNFPAKVSYEFTTDSDSDRMILLRSEQLFSGEKSIGSDQKELILEGFSEITIQAADPDKGSLTDSWKNNLQCSKRPPKAVKILLKWPKDKQEDFNFETIIKIVSQGQITHP